MAVEHGQGTHILGHAQLDKSLQTEITPSVLVNHEIKLEINTRRPAGKSPSTREIIHTLVSHPWVRKEGSEEETTQTGDTQWPSEPRGGRRACQQREEGSQGSNLAPTSET